MDIIALLIALSDNQLIHVWSNTSMPDIDDYFGVDTDESDWHKAELVRNCINAESGDRHRPSLAQWLEFLQTARSLGYISNF